MASESAAAATAVGLQKPHLVLHFDVNKTVLLCDPVSGMDVIGMLQSIVSECSWGTVDEHDKWTLTHTTPLFRRPSAAHVTYSDFLEYGQFKLLPNPDGDSAIRAQNKKAKADKKLKKKIFTNPGEPGERMRPCFESLEKHLRIPEHLRDECATHALTHLHGEYLFLLASFFRSLDALQREGRTFTVIFRTFGTETREVVESFNAFRMGEHPLVPEPACTNAKYHRGTIAMPAQIGCFHRSLVPAVIDENGVETQPAKENVRLLIGTVDPEKVPPTREVVGFQAIHDFLEKESLKGVNWALRDFYPYWAEHAEASHAGKPHPVDPTTTSECHHIFFDDNIEREFAHIVDCRDLSNNSATIPFEQALDHWMVKAEPAQALLDDLYFRKAIARCEANVAKLRGTESPCVRGDACDCGTRGSGGGASADGDGSAGGGGGGGGGTRGARGGDPSLL